MSLGLKYLGDQLPKYVQDSDILDSVATSQSACSVTVNILTDLLTFDKIEDGELKLDRQDVSVKDLIVSSTAIFQAQVTLELTPSPTTALTYTMSYLRREKRALR